MARATRLWAESQRPYWYSTRFLVIWGVVARSVRNRPPPGSPIMKFSLLRFSAILVVFLTGCPHDCFEVEVRPAGQTFQRKLTGWHLDGENDKEVQPLSAEQLARIGRLYPKRETPDNASKHVFSGQFTDRTPADVGGAGFYTHFTSPLGSTSCYVERFRGKDDLESQLSQRRQAAEKLTDLVIGWLTAELGRDPNFPRLKKFLDEDLRRDLKNLGVYEFTGRATEDYQKEPNGEFLSAPGSTFANAATSRRKRFRC